MGHLGAVPAQTYPGGSGRKAFHYFLPAALVETTTFDNEWSSPARADEETLAEALALSIHGTYQEVAEKRDRGDGDDDEGDEEADE